MNAVEFVRKFGWEKVLHVTKFAPCIPERDYHVDLVQLKELLLNYELVKKLGGTKEAKSWLSAMCRVWGDTPHLDKAIRDVESVGGGV